MKSLALSHQAAPHSDITTASDAIQVAAASMVANWNGVTPATIATALAAGNPYVQLHYRRALLVEAALCEEIEESAEPLHRHGVGIVAIGIHHGVIRWLAQASEAFRRICLQRTQFLVELLQGERGCAAIKRRVCALGIAMCGRFFRRSDQALKDSRKSHNSGRPGTDTRIIANRSSEDRRSGEESNRAKREVDALVQARIQIIEEAAIPYIKHGLTVGARLTDIARLHISFPWKAATAAQDCVLAAPEFCGRSRRKVDFPWERSPKDGLNRWVCSDSLDENVSRPNTVVHRLANGYFSRHPLQGMAVLFIGFVLACSAAPAFELLLEGL